MGRTRKKRRGRMRASGSGGRRCRTWRSSMPGSRRGWITGVSRRRASGDREPELHRGPAVSGIEARGEVSEVGERQREQRQERALEREAVVAEVRVVTREEMALERVAVRERRELAQEVTGEDREAVLKRVEADRREQIERAQAAAERRVERRQGLSIGGQIKETYSPRRGSCASGSGSSSGG
jgi:hypothetical protein